MTRRKPVAPKEIRDDVEQSIARGWSNEQIMERLQVPYRTVHAIRCALDKLALEDEQL